MATQDKKRKTRTNQTTNTDSKTTTTIKTMTMAMAKDKGKDKIGTRIGTGRKMETENPIPFSYWFLGYLSIGYKIVNNSIELKF